MQTGCVYVCMFLCVCVCIPAQARVHCQVLENLKTDVPVMKQPKVAPLHMLHAPAEPGGYIDGVRKGMAEV